MGKQIKYTLADQSTIIGTRNLWDVFSDGWSSKVIHQGKKTIRISNHWIIKTEDVTDDHAK